MSKKEKCKRCGRVLRTKNFVLNKVLGELVCKTCDKQIGSNKFYDPTYKERSDRISKYNLSDQEKKILARKKGWNRVNQDLKILKGMKDKSQKKRKEEREEINKNKDLNKKLLEGLKQN